MTGERIRRGKEGERGHPDQGGGRIASGAPNPRRGKVSRRKKGGEEGGRPRGSHLVSPPPSKRPSINLQREEEEVKEKKKKGKGGRKGSAANGTHSE